MEMFTKKNQTWKTNAGIPRIYNGFLETNSTYTGEILISAVIRNINIIKYELK